MNKDQVAGRADKVKGKIKEVTGKVVGNKELEAEGRTQSTAGKVRAGYGDLKEDIKKAAE
ncbi:CsbD family protein [Pseudothauera lacus]|uniref:CsbD family protein n=1 Tax=Pseudothauera lacus TaxID=2136175 RepID=A0A2T4IFA6_9RHOO|nr:CsbD family protein [Pseudothauera lacus]PTD96462.1 CsbD family protein [Pseudothauera lacus]